VFFPITQTSPCPCLLPGLAKADATFAVDAQTPEEDTRAPAPACKTCARSGHRGSRRCQFPASPSPDNLGELRPHETLAEAAPCACMQRTARTTVICRRLPPNQMVEAPLYRFGQSRAGRRASGPIRPRSSEAWLDLASLLFSPECFYDI
jgi:hypothetical protein